MNGDTYREVNDLDHAKAYIGALERENAQLQWKLIQMGQLVQKLGGHPGDAYRSNGRIWSGTLTAWVVFAIASFFYCLLTHGSCNP
jgi:hypothetical protein